MSKRVAVFIHAHFDCLKLRHLIEHLKGGKHYDLYICEDCTNGHLDIFDVPVLKHNVKMFQDQGFCPANFSWYMWFLTDYPIYHNRQHLPDYDYYIQLDYDTGFTNRTPGYMDKLCEKLLSYPQIDLCGPDLYARNDGWWWGYRFRQLYPYFDQVWGVFGTPLILSGGAIDYLRHIRLNEASVRGYNYDNYLFMEVFLATFLKQDEKFVCVDLNDVWPNSYDKATFNHADSFFMEQPLGNHVEMHHSVLDADTLVKKTIKVANQDQVPNVISRLLGSEYISDEQRALLSKSMYDLVKQKFQNR